MPPNQFSISLLQVLKEKHQKGGKGTEWERRCRERNKHQTTATTRFKSMNTKNPIEGENKANLSAKIVGGGGGAPLESSHWLVESDS